MLKATNHSSIQTSNQAMSNQSTSSSKQATKQGRTIKIRSRVVIIFYWSDWSVEICCNFCVLLNSCSEQRVSQINPLIHLPAIPQIHLLQVLHGELRVYPAAGQQRDTLGPQRFHRGLCVILAGPGGKEEVTQTSNRGGVGR